jgi:hypothetical protein
MQYCSYYQAHVPREHCWFLTATIRSYEHMAFDRTLDKENSIFEFFVPQDMESLFLQVMARFEKEGIIKDLQKLPNRLM